MDAEPAWRVVKVDDTTIIVPGGGPVRAKRVTFTLADGSSSYVEVPLDQFTPTVIAGQITQMAKQHYSIIALEGPMMGMEVQG